MHGTLRCQMLVSCEPMGDFFYILMTSCGKVLNMVWADNAKSPQWYLWEFMNSFVTCYSNEQHACMIIPTIYRMGHTILMNSMFIIIVMNGYWAKSSRRRDFTRSRKPKQVYGLSLNPELAGMRSTHSILNPRSYPVVTIQIQGEREHGLYK